MLFRLAKFVSYFLHPACIPTYLFAVLFFLSPCFMVWSPTIKLYLLAFIFLGTFCFPVSVTWFLLYSKQIKSFEMIEQADRRKPFLITTMFYASLAFLFSYGVFEGTLLSYLMISTALVVCLATILNLYHKVSMHSAGIGASVGILFALQYHDNRYELLFPILIAILLAGIVSSSRLFLLAHKPMEVLTGSLLGVFIGFISLMALLAS